MTAAQHAIDVLVDGSGRLGPLSYLVPDHLEPVPGEVVEVPFGKTVRFGLVTGEGDVLAATKTILSVVGRRSDPDDITAALTLSRRHLHHGTGALSRLSPPRHKGAEPQTYLPPQLVDPVDIEHGGALVGKTSTRRFLLRPLDSDPAALAARFAMEFATNGQVLVLCPTTELVEAVLQRFHTGADRLDAHADRGAWASFRDGHLPIGVGTRACSWYSPAHLGGIVVVESAHPGHVEAREPHMSARDVALERTIGRGNLVMFDTRFDIAALRDGVTMWEPAQRWWPTVTWWDRQPRAVPTNLKSELARWGRRGDDVLVVAGDTCRRLCRRCRLTHDCSDHHPAECTCTRACRRCGDTDTFVVGWDAKRLSDHFAAIPGCEQRNIVDQAALTQVKRQYQKVVMLSGEVSATHFTPVQATLNRLTDAARITRDELAVVVQDRRHPAVVAAADGKARPMMRAVWDEAKRLGFPPFGHVARIVSTRPNPPDLSSVPGRKLGPRRNRDGNWEFLLCFTDDDLAALSAPMERLKKRGNIQIHVDGPTHLL